MTTRRSAKHDPAPAIVWFRDDLRLSDHPALTAAVGTGRPILPVYVFDAASPGLRPLGGASKWWLARSLVSLAHDIAAAGATLRVIAGAAGDVLPALAAESDAAAVFWSRRYEPAERAVDDAVETQFGAAGIEVQTFNGTLWHEPGDILQKGGGWYKIYTPYWRVAAASGLQSPPLAAPKRLQDASFEPKSSRLLAIEDLGLSPAEPDWSGGLAAAWRPGERQAQAALHGFVEDRLDRYADDRNTPAIEGSSRLSPHLRFGEVSPGQVIAAVEAAARRRHSSSKAKKYLQEIVWRDFSYNLLAHVPDLREKSYNPRFEQFRWTKPDTRRLKAWQRGHTGYPIVDAGMRQLWQTGWMHNRVRMITASFLCKHLLMDWRIGEAWFWDTLCDADPANNAVNWQWVAGTGPDASPFFRIFNPVTQAESFDPDGAYVRRFVPELADLDARWIHKPWEAPAGVLAETGIRLGTSYPRPIVDHAAARQAALDAFKASRQPDGQLTLI